MAVLSVAAWGLVRGEEVAGPATIEVVDEAVRVAVQGRAATVFPIAALDGVRAARGTLTLYVGTGDVVELTDNDALLDLGRRIESAACDVPELTLALRALGSARGNPGAEHDRFYAPFLAARGGAQRAGDAAARLSALDAARLRGELEGVLQALAAQHHPRRAPDRRALETKLGELAAPAFAALDRLGEAARAFAEQGDEVSFVRWREWAAACRAVFAEVDRCWAAAAPALAGEQEERVGFWRRLWRRRA
jgi:hypothetical protein